MAHLLTELQTTLIIGTLLGDGCSIANRKKDAARLQIRHKLKDTQYVDWKYSFLEKMVLTPPRLDRHNNSRYFRTRNTRAFGKLREIFYPQEKECSSFNYYTVATSVKFSSLVYG